MSMQAQAYGKYQKSTVESATPEMLLMMLFEGAIKYIRNAGKAIQANEVKTAHEEIIKAEDIILELMTTLNMDYEVSHNLMALYDYIYQQLIQANLKKEVEYLDLAEPLLVELRDTFQGAALSARMQTNSNMDNAAQVAPMPEPEEKNDVVVPVETASDRVKQSYTKPKPGVSPVLLTNTTAVPSPPAAKAIGPGGINIQG